MGQPLFYSGQLVICIDSNGEFDDGSKWDLVEGKSYTVCNPDFKSSLLLPNIVAIKLTGARGVYDQLRFIPASDDQALEDEIKSALNEDIKVRI